MCLQCASKHPFDANVQIIGIELFIHVKIKLLKKKYVKHTRSDVVHVVILKSIEHVLTRRFFLQNNDRSKKNHANAFINA